MARVCLEGKEGRRRVGREADEWDYEDEKGEGEKEQKEREEEEENEEEEGAALEEAPAGSPSC